MCLFKHCWGVVFAVSILFSVGTAFSQDTDFEPDVILAGHTAEITDLEYSADGTRLLSSSIDGKVNLWDIPNESVMLSITVPFTTAPATAVAFFPNSNEILVGTNDATIRLYDNSGQLIREYVGHNGAITSLAFSPDGSRFVSGSEGNNAIIWNTATGEKIFTLTEHLSNIWSVDYSSTSPLVVTASQDNTAIIWNALDGSIVRTLTGHTLDIYSVSFSPDGSQILTGSYDNTAKLWDTNTGSLITTLSGHTDWVYAVDFSPSENKVATGSWDLNTRIWNLSTQQTERILQSQSSAFTANAYKPDSSQLATGNFDGIIWLWNINTQIEPTPTLTPSPTLTPTPTFTPTVPAPPTSTFTATPIGPTPTPRPDGIVLTFDNVIKVYDDTNSTTDITGQTDFDTADGRQLVIEWDADTTNVTDWHIYAQTDIYGYFYLGNTGSADVKRFEWPGSSSIAPDQAGGPAFGNTYKFRVFGLLTQPGFNVVTHSKPVAYALEGSAASTVFTVPPATLPEGTMLVTDDMFDFEDLSGKTDTDSADQKALFIRWNVGSGEYWNYHVFVSVNGGEYEFAGQTSGNDVNYFRWSDVHLFDTKGVYTAGPQSGNTYQFRIFGLTGSGFDLIDQAGSVMYMVE